MQTATAWATPAARHPTAEASRAAAIAATTKAEASGAGGTQLARDADHLLAALAEAEGPGRTITLDAATGVAAVTAARTHTPAAEPEAAEAAPLSPPLATRQAQAATTRVSPERAAAMSSAAQPESQTPVAGPAAGTAAHPASASGPLGQAADLAGQQPTTAGVGEYNRRVEAEQQDARRHALAGRQPPQAGRSSGPTMRRPVQVRAVLCVCG
jgi:hypothetical protein